MSGIPLRGGCADIPGGHWNRIRQHFKIILPILAASLAACVIPSQLVFAAETKPVGAAWPFDPYNDGQQLPPSGRSLFDYLFSSRRRNVPAYDIPFPFSALRDRINRELESGDPDRNIRQVLLPHGRSLQRGLAAPDYFAYPRVVLAVAGKTRLQENHAGMLLKDRLYIGYQEKANLLEVISYNETAARFEFQIVQDYAPGKQPRVSYANRSVCLTCHQNHAPIFSTPLWSETNANPDIAKRLTRTSRDYYGIDTGRGIDIPNAIDLATDLANLFSVTQALWRRGCGPDKNNHRSIHCRASALETMLRYRLGGNQHIDTGSPGYKTGFLPAFNQAWNHNWPNGMSIPNPDIPNRIPFQAASNIGLTESAQLNINVPANLDPLRPRPALEVWSQSRAEKGLIRGLAQFVSAADMIRLDNFIYKAGKDSGRPVDRYSGTCTVVIKQLSAHKERIGFQCPVDELSSDNQAAATGRVYMENGRLSGGSFDRLEFTTDVPGISDLEVVDGALQQTDSQQLLELAVRRSGLHARRSDGNAIESVEIRFATPEAQQENRKAIRQITGTIEINILRDFDLVHEAIVRMRDRSISGTSALFTDRPFERSNLVRSLFHELKMPTLDWCCTTTAKLPAMVHSNSTQQPAVSDTDPVSLSPVEKKFFQYCATCHQSNDRFPPNFLDGNIEQVKASLALCAPRIHVRLQMWAHPSPGGAKTPMPPLRSLHQKGMDRATWVNSDDLTRLQDYIRALVKPGYPQRQSYESLPPCLPD